MLLVAGVNVNVLNTAGKTPLHIAITKDLQGGGNRNI